MAKAKKRKASAAKAKPSKKAAGARRRRPVRPGPRPSSARAGATSPVPARRSRGRRKDSTATRDEPPTRAPRKREARAASKKKRSVLERAYDEGITANLLQTYLREISAIPLLTPEKEKELAWRHRRSGDEDALWRLVEANLRFVVTVAKRYRHHGGISFHDLINEGNLGLIQGARRFDPAKNVRLVTYAMWWIRQSILRALSEYEQPFKLPSRKATLSHHIARSAKDLRSEHEREPSLDEIAEDVGTTPEEVSELYGMRQESLDEVLDEESGFTRLDSLKQKTVPSAEDALLRRMLIARIGEVLARLSEREERVLRLRFGIYGGEAMTLEEIGDVMCLSRERVRQIEKNAVNKLRRSRLAFQLRGCLN